MLHPRLKLRPSATTRAIFYLLGDILIWTGALWGAFLLRFDGVIPARYLSHIPLLLLTFIPIKFAWYAAGRLYQCAWRSVGFAELMSVVKTNTLALLTIAAVLLLLRYPHSPMSIPRSVLLMDYVLATYGVAVFRAGRRGWLLSKRTVQRWRRSSGIRLLIVGAGAAGLRVVQTLSESKERTYEPVGFIDDDPAKQGAFVGGLRVFGGREMLPRVVREENVQEVLIAIPAAQPARLGGIIKKLREAGITRIKTLSDIHEWLAGRIILKDVREIDLHDLLARPSAHVRRSALTAYFAGKRVLVTGGAGSIGSELVRQLARLKVELVVAADTNESGLFELENEVVREMPNAHLRTTITDVRDVLKVDWLMRTTHPDVVIHAAAYKHVPMMEREVEEAVKTNVFGVLMVGEAALRHGVKTFVFVSSDKAVNPTNVLGASKRLGELIVQVLHRRGSCRFLAVRFGNVLGSRGSLIPLLQEQIRRGGPVTVTHPDMERYFMTVDEAVLLLLQTPSLSTSNSLFMLDMGKPVHVIDLVRELIRLSGMQEDKDIPIVFSGVRDGEKIREDLLMPDERAIPTELEHVNEIHCDRGPDEITLRLALRELERLVEINDSEGLNTLLKRIAKSPVEMQPTALGSAARAASV